MSKEELKNLCIGLVISLVAVNAILASVVFWLKALH